MPLAILPGRPPPDALVALLNESVVAVEHVGERYQAYKPEPPRPLLPNPSDSLIEQFVYAIAMRAMMRIKREIVVMELRRFRWRDGFTISVYVPSDASENDIIRALQVAERAAPGEFYEHLVRRW